MQTPVITPATAAKEGQYKLKIEVDGCFSSEAILDVDVKNKPALPNISSNTPICEGETLMLFADNVSGASYSWTSTGALPLVSSDQNPERPNATPAMSGNYKLKVNVDGCESNEAVLTVAVHPIPATPAITSNGPVCEGGALQLNTIAVAGATYLWAGPDGFSSGNQNPLITDMTSAKAGTYKLVVSVNGCLSAEVTHDVAVKTKPSTPELLSNTPVCAGDTLKLFAAEISGAVYAWTGPGFVSSLQNPERELATIAMSGDYKLIAKLDGCFSDESIINVQVKPTPAIPIISSNAPLCEGLILKLNANETIGATYNWTGPNGYNSNEQNPERADALPTMTGEYKLFVDVNGCESPEATTNVWVKNKPAKPTITSNAPICEGANLTLSTPVVAGGSYLWEGPNSFQSTNNNVTRNNATPAMSGDYQLKVFVAGCESEVETINVQIIDKPATPIITSNSPVCEGDDLTLTTDQVTNATYIWTGPALFTSGVYNPTIAGVTAGNGGIYKLKVEVGNCKSDEASHTVTILNKPAPPITQTNAPICVGSDLNLNVTAVPNTVFSWQAPDGSTLAGQNPTISNAQLSDEGFYICYATSNNCKSEEVLVNVEIKENPASPSASSNSPVCEGDIIHLTAEAVLNANYEWKNNLDEVIGTQKDIDLPNANQTMSGTYTVTAISGICKSVPGEVVVTVNEKPAIPVINVNSPVCEGEPLNFSTNTISGASYEWKNQDGVVVGNSTTINYPVSDVSMSGQWTLTTNVNNCVSDLAKIDVTITPKPASPLANSNTPLCEGATLTLSAQQIVGASYEWLNPSGITIGNDREINITAIQTSDAGVYKVKTTVNNCESDYTEVSVVVNAIPTKPDASVNSPICEGGTIVLTAQNVAGATYTWTGINNENIGSQANLTIDGATTSMSGNYSVYIVVDGCQSEATLVNLLVNAKPATPQASSNSPICKGSTLTLNATPVAGASYSWKNDSGIEIGSNAAVQISNVSLSDAGTYSVELTKDGCKSDVATVNVVIHDLPAKPEISHNSPLCVGEQLLLTTSAVTNAIYEWKNNQEIVISNNQNVAIDNVVTTMSGVYTLVVSVNGCVSPEASVTIQIKPNPATPNISSNSPICEGQIINFSSETITNAIYEWINPQGNVFSSEEDPQVTDATINHSGQYVLKVKVDGCYSIPAITDVSVLGKPTKPIATTNAPICFGETLTLSTQEITGAAYAWYDKNGTLVSDQASHSFASATNALSGTYKLIVIVDGCESEPEFVNVQVKDLPAKPSISSNAPICEGETLNLNTNLVPNALYEWSKDNNVISNQQNVVLNDATTSTSGKYFLKISVDGCESEKAQLDVIVKAKPVAPIISSNDPICEGEKLTLSTNPVNGASYEWKDNNLSVIGDQSIYEINNATSVNSGNYSLVIGIDGCKSDPSIINVIIKEKPATPQIIDNSPICEGDTLILSTIDISGATYEWKNNLGVVIGNQREIQIENALTTASGNYSLKVSIDNCESAVANANVIIKAKPALPMAASNSPICEGETLTLTSNAVAGASYEWINQNGQTISTKQNESINNAITSLSGEYNLKVSIDGCTSETAILTVVVKAKPTIPTINVNTPVCEGETLDFSTSSEPGASYIWTGPNGFDRAVQNPQLVNATTLDNGTFSLQIKVDGCTSEAATKEVVVNAKPSIPAINSNSPVCENFDLELSTIFVPGATYFWSGPNNFTYNDITPKIDNATSIHSGDYHLYIVVNGCKSDIASVEAKILAQPLAPVITANSPVCIGDAISLSTADVTSASYQWTGPDLFTATERSPNINNAQLKNSGIYKLIVTVGGCKSEETSFDVKVRDCDCPIDKNNVNSPSLTAFCGKSGPFTIIGEDALPTGGVYRWDYSTDGAIYVPYSLSINNLRDLTISDLSTIGSHYFRRSYSTTSDIICEEQSNTIEIKIKDRPSPPVIGNNGPLCEGNDLFLTTSAVIANADYLWTGPAAFNSNSPNTVITGMTLDKAGDYELKVSIDGCISEKAITSVAVNAKPAPPTLSSNSPLCEGQDLKLEANTISGAIYSWTGPNLISNLEDPIITTVTSVNAGEYMGKVSINNCVSDEAKLQVVINKNPSLPVISGNSPICEFDEINLSADFVAGANYLWSGPLSFVGNTQSIKIDNASLNHKGDYKLKVEVNGCSSPETLYSVEVKDSPEKPEIIGNSPVCIGDDIALGPKDEIAGASYQWSGPSPFNSTSKNPVITDVDANNGGIYYLTVTNIDGCESEEASLEIRVENCDCPITGNDLTNPTITAYCGESDAIMLSGSDPLPAGGDFYWEYSNDGNAFIKANGANTNKDYLTEKLVEGKHYFRRKYTTTSGIICDKQSNMIIIEVKEKPQPINVSSNGPVCEGQDVQLNADLVPGAIYAWTGPNSYQSNSQNPKLVAVSNLEEGIYELTISVNSCKGDVASTFVKVNSKPAAPAISSDSPVCAGSDLSLIAADAAIGQYEWTGPNNFKSNDQNPVIKNASTSDAGDYKLIYTLGGCSSDPVLLNTHIKDLPAKPSITGVSPVCEGKNIELFTSTIANANYSWSGPLFTSTVEDPVITSVTSANAGYYELYITVDGCKSETAQFEVLVKNCDCAIESNIISLPGADKFCANAGSLLISGTDALPADGKYTWEYSSNGITYTTANGINNTKNYQTENLASGIHYFRRKFETISGIICEDISNSVIITIKDVPQSPIAGNDGPVCVGGNLQLSASTIPGANYSWTSPTGFVSVEQNPILQNVTAANAGDYIVHAIVDGCQSSDAVTSVKIKSLPVITSISSNSPVCEGKDILLTTAAINGAEYSWSGPLTFNSKDQNPIITDAQPAKAGNYVLTVKVDGCESLPATVAVTTKNCACDIAGNNIAEPNQSSYCDNVSNLILSGNDATPSGGSYQWQYSFNGGNFEVATGVSNQKAYTISLLGEGSHRFRRIYSKLVAPLCADTSNILLVNVVSNNIQAVITSNAPICEGENLLLEANHVSGANYTWTGPNNFIENSETVEIKNVSTLAKGTYKLTIDVPGCTSKEASAFIDVKSKPALPILESVVIVCEGDDVNIVPQNVAGNAIYSWTGPNQFISGNKTLDIQNVALKDAGAYLLNVSVNGCKSDEANTTLIVNKLPKAPAIQSNASNCEGSDIQLVAELIAGATYEWTGPNNYSANVNNPVINGLNALHEGIYSVRINNDGCWSKPSTIDLVVNKKPALPVITSLDEVCEGKDLVLSAANVSGATYNWTGPNNFISVLNNEVITDVKPNNAGTYTLKVVVNGCESETASISIKVKDCSCNISDNVIRSADPTIYCEESKALIIDGSEPSPSGGEYKWEYSKDSISFIVAEGLNDKRSYNSDKLNLGHHYFRRLYFVNNGNLCTDTSNVWAINVASNDPSSIEISLDPDPACIGDTIMVLIDNAVNGISYNWQVLENGMSIVSSNGRMALFTPEESGIYDIEVRQLIEGCSESLPANVKLTVKQGPAISIGQDTTICPKDGNITLKVNEGFADYLWSDGSTSNSIEVSEKGEYTVTVADEFGCISTDIIRVKNFCCKINYPNIFIVDGPSKNHAFKLVDDGCVISSKLRIYDRWGNLVYISDNGLEPWDGTMNGKYVEQGVYTFLFNYTALDENDEEFHENISGDVTVIRQN